MNVLVAVLNWGLGHATRCIPVINELQKAGAHVIIASDGEALILLKKEINNAEFCKLPSYNIRYSKSNFYWNIIAQSKNIFYAIRKEKEITKKIVVSYQIDRIISDNRYGCYSDSLPSVMITHQLQLISKNVFASFIFKITIRLWLSNFDFIWIPDDPKIKLSGKLSTPYKSLNFAYIGLLSRLKCIKKSSNSSYDLVAILSGPEPQRTYFEKEVIKQSQNFKNKKILIVRGVLNDDKTKVDSINLKVIQHLKGDEIMDIIRDSNHVICRSGYSSLMDYYCSHIHPIVVATPGQLEQEYLAKYLGKRNLVSVQRQGDLNFSEIFSKKEKYSQEYHNNNENLLSLQVKEFLSV